MRVAEGSGATHMFVGSDGAHRTGEMCGGGKGGGVERRLWEMGGV